MSRTIKMTSIAQQALWSKTTESNHIPTQFYIEGDKSTGYEISRVNDDLCGFPMITVRTLYAAKLICEQINNTGKSDWDTHMIDFTYAWKNHPIEL